MELKGVNSKELSYVVDEEFGQLLQEAGVETVIVDNDRKTMTRSINGNHLGKRTVDSSTTSSPLLKISVKRKFKMQLIFSQKL